MHLGARDTSWAPAALSLLVLGSPTLPFLFPIYNASKRPIYSFSIWKKTKKKKTSPRVQTMPNVSFGPVFIVPALLIMYLVEYNLNTLFSIEIIQKKKKNTY